MKKKLLFFLLLICIFPVTCFASEKQVVTFSSCVDGDTAKVYLNEEEIKVRFLAVDTPETKHPTKGEEPYGKEASNYTCNRLQNANKIEIELDDNSDKQDKYDRYLVWIFVDDSLLQEELVSKGYAKVAYLYDDYKYTDDLESTQAIAKEQKLGIWKETKEEVLSQKEIIIVVCVVILFLLFFVLNKKYRKKTITKVKRKTKSYLNKELKKLLK